MLGFSRMGCLPLNRVGWVEVRNPTILNQTSTQPTKLFHFKGLDLPQDFD
jgi:hypothetical protein